MNCKQPGIVFDRRYFDHVIGRPSPENPDRLRSLYRRLEAPPFRDRLCRIQPREARSIDILSVHSGFYLDQIRELSLGDDPYGYDRDTYLMESSLYTARLAAGGCLALADRIMDGTIDYGFALIRPPGHHAEPGRGMGFCILNNVAITAEYLRREYGLERILIVDFDVHHGNGTQAVFYDTRQVLVTSIHQEKIFPFTGGRSEIGEGDGLGYTINLPVHAQFGDGEYTFLLGKVLTCLSEQYLPQFILVSAGFDAHEEDTISRTLLSTAWFGLAAEILKWLAAESADNRLLFILEGGYNPASLEASVLTTIEALCRPRGPRPGIGINQRADMILRDHPLRHHWTL